MTGIWFQGRICKSWTHLNFTLIKAEKKGGEKKHQQNTKIGQFWAKVGEIVLRKREYLVVSGIVMMSALMTLYNLRTIYLQRRWPHYKLNFGQTIAGGAYSGQIIFGDASNANSGQTRHCCRVAAYQGDKCNNTVHTEQCKSFLLGNVHFTGGGGTPFIPSRCDECSYSFPTTDLKNHMKKLHNS